ncbi:Mce-associated membrane protein [Nocardioides aromaticivorans]|uniref:Mce-associated membrane protein n=1 Tax=Nocardioides aromaticivorans TaxID=200618 RepID=A0A7Z0CQL6_9ACTN|nr:hypothetical protein [Nocardioides aromaticivorans]NYI47115.1 Mce-associated membrane protein [Nocardioides aromaticivorans]QSR26257.1 hypothetical protein CFH99_11520 [Nocardioides aromaticivorans]
MSSASTNSTKGAGPGNLVIALAAALVVALAACAWLLVDRQSGDDGADARSQVRELQAEKAANKDAITAASAFVTKATSYSYEDGKHDFAWIDELQNKEVRERLEKNVADLKKAIEVSKTSAKGQVVEAAGRVVSAEQVEVLAYYSQAITDDSGEVSVQDGSILMTMKLIGADWKVDSLQFLSQVGS